MQIQDLTAVGISEVLQQKEIMETSRTIFYINYFSTFAIVSYKNLSGFTLTL